MLVNIFLAILCLCPPISIQGVDITVVTVLLGHNIYPLSNDRTGAGVDMGLEKMATLLPADVNIKHVRRTYPGPSCKNHVAAIAADVYHKNNVTVLVGPSCSHAVEIVGRMASHWNLPLLSPIATDTILDNKKDFNTLTRLYFNMKSWANTVLAICIRYDWMDVFIIYDNSMYSYMLFATSTERVLNTAGMRAYRQFFDSTQSYDMEQLLLKARERSRVVVFAMDNDDLRTFMLLAQTLGMTNGEYAFFKQRSNNIKFEWYRNDTLDSTAKKAYEALLFIQVRMPDSPEYYEFENEYKKRTLRDYNYEETSVSGGYTALSYYMALTTYAYVLNDSLARGENYMNGTLISSKIWGHKFPGIGDDLSIDENGDREMDFSVMDTDPVTGETVLVANYLGIQKELDFKREIHWPNNAGPPLNEPICGFLGNSPACEATSASFGTYAAIILSVVSAISVIIVLLILRSYRNFKLEAEIQSQWWKVKWNDVVLSDTSCQLNSMKSSQYSMQVSKVGDGHLYKFGTYKGAQVMAKTLHITTIKLERTTLLQLKDMRDIPCPNLCRFYGICLDEGHAFMLWEHCTRGSLSDLLHNDDIMLEIDFKLALMNDLVKGMSYIQDSNIKVHGSLNSNNCLIDSRFVLKIIGFGLSTIKDQEMVQEDRNRHELFYVAPEHLSVDPFRNASQAGDVYSFGIVLYELLTRTEPYEEDVVFMDLEEILKQIQDEQTKKRPKIILSSDVDTGLLTLMKECWNAVPSSRPTFNIIKQRIKEMFPNLTAKHVLDSLLQRMEQYSNNLEGLVEERTKAFLDEKRKSEELLLEILPKSVADKLKNGAIVEPEAFESVTIYFSDIIEFTSMSAKSTPMEVIDLLNDLYLCFDSIIENFDVYKVETIGDAYMVASGLPIKNGMEHVRQIARMTLSILASVKFFRIRHLPSTQLQARFGIHTGAVCAGVVGRKMPRYCLFGDTVNMASRMESNGEAMKIHISQDTRDSLSFFDTFVMKERGMVKVKGKGMVTTYWLETELESKEPVSCTDV